MTQIETQIETLRPRRDIFLENVPCGYNAGCVKNKKDVLKEREIISASSRMCQWRKTFNISVALLRKKYKEVWVQMLLICIYSGRILYFILEVHG